MLEEDLDPDPIVQFGRWFDAAQRNGLPQPEAMAVATATPHGRPSVRMVLLKDWGPDGFVFYTDYESRKGDELAVNPRTALLFHWQPLGRQVRVSGAAQEVTREMSAAYFSTRPIGSQVAAAISRQSREIASRDELEEAFRTKLQETGGRPLPLPERWGGYRVSPDEIEFWEHRDDRLHDRVRFRKTPSGWETARLQP